MREKQRDEQKQAGCGLNLWPAKKHIVIDCKISGSGKLVIFSVKNDVMEKFGFS